MALAIAHPTAPYVPDVVSPARVRKLFTLCLCGRDLGDHMVDPPHAGDPQSGSRPCRGFRPARSRKAPHPADARRGGASR
jgi:hypothetical protein